MKKNYRSTRSLNFLQNAPWNSVLCRSSYISATVLPPFSLIRDFGKQNTRRNVSKISISLACYRQIGFEIHQSQPLVGPSDLLYFMLAGCDWWISIRSVDNMYDLRKFWKHFCRCFVFESRVSTKTVATFIH